MLSVGKRSCTSLRPMIIEFFRYKIPAVTFERRLTLLTTSSITTGFATHSAQSLLMHKFIANALRNAAKLNLFRQGQHLHGHIIKFGYQDRLSLRSLLLSFYIKCGSVSDACLLFDEILVRSVISWNHLICGLAKKVCDSGSKFLLGFRYFRRMLLDLVKPDRITFLGLLRICLDTNKIVMGRVLHSFIMKLGLCRDCFVSSALVDMYAKFGIVEEARQVFELVLEKDMVLWNVMVSCYSLNCSGEDALKFYKLMRLEGFLGDHFTFTSLFNSCSSSGFCEFGRGIHGLVVKLCFDLDVVVSSSLVDMYAKNEHLVDARKVFDRMILKNVVSWTTMIVGYGQYGDGIEAIKLLHKMLQEDFHPDELTLASVLTSCGDLAMAGETTQVHAFTVKIGFSSFTSVANATTIAYSKCGSIGCALQTFRSILEPDLLSWTSIIGAHGKHSFSNEATELFEKMLSDGVKPDRIAFLEVLSACCHGGLVNKGLRYFTLMVEVYKIVPDSEHYACLVDLFGRVGLLKEAFDFLNLVPIEPSSDILGAFLGACKIHRNIGLAKWAAEQLFALEPNKPVNYALMSNMYASTGAWWDVASMRKLMRERCYRKVPGCSWIEIAGKLYSFVSGDNSHPQAVGAYSLLGLLCELMKEENDEFAEN